MRSILVPLVAASVASLALSGCATKKYVGREVGEINQKVDTLSGEMEKTQERVKSNEVRIDDVDKQAQAGISDAKGSAQTALKRATEAERAEALRVEQRSTALELKADLERMERTVQDVKAKRGTLAVRVAQSRAGGGAEASHDAL